MEDGTKIIWSSEDNESMKPNKLFMANGKLFFTANDGMHAPELWVVYDPEQCATGDWILCQ